MSSSSYRSVLKSTSLIGGSSFINVLIGMVRNKFVAVLLGPAGTGLIGMYSVILSLVGTVSSVGIASSGVRQIAEAQGTGDQEKIGRTVKALRRTVWVTGLLGMLFMIFGCTFLSRTAFGTADHALQIALLGITILFGEIAVGQSCLLQGTRRIRALATVSVIGGLNGAVISIPCFYLWGQRGIVPSIILTSATALATSWWFARQVVVKPVAMTLGDSTAEARKLLHFGVPLMLAGLMSGVSGYLIPALLVRRFGLEGVGVWQAAFTLSGVLVNFVLSAMATDYYPRLTALAGDTRLLGEEVNAQTEIALFLAMPGLAATIIFAPLAVAIFYSGKFGGAVDILRWSVYGALGRVISWPLGFVLLAKGMGKTFLCTEFFSNAFYVLAIWSCTHLWGLQGAGIAFLSLYVVYTFIIYIVVNVTSHTAWTRANMVLISSFTAFLTLVGLISAFVRDPLYKFPADIFLLSTVSVYCFRQLSQKSGITLQVLANKLRFHG